MLLGLETYSYHLSFAYGKMDIIQFIEKTAELGLNGVQINAEGEDLAHLGSDDPDFLHEVKNTADRLGLFIEIDTCGTNPQNLTRALNICKALGADTLRVYSSIGGDVQEDQLLFSLSSLSSDFIIFPTGVNGSSARNSICRGTL